MPIVDIPTMRLDTALDTPKGFQVTPGFADIEKGSNTPPRENWASTLDSPLLSTVAGATSALGAAFRRDNLIGSALSAEDRRPGEWDYSYKPYDDIKGTEYEQHSDTFLDARNANHARSIKRQIDQEVEDVKTLGAMPWYQSVPVELLAGGFDLPTLMPAGAFVRSVKGGFSVARTAVSVGTMAGVSSTTQEAGLHAIQETRTVEESAVNIGASVLLGSLIGAGGAKLLSNVEWNEGVRALDRIVAKEPVPDAKVTTSHPSSIGAAALEPHTLDETAVAGAVAGGLARATRPLNPAMRISQSPNSATREVGSNLFEMSTYMRGNEDGFASPVSAETLRKEWDGGLMLAVQATRNNYSSYRKAGGNLSRSEFESETGKAMRRGDEHAIPEVAAAAKSWRSNVIEPLKEAAIKAKLLPEDVSVETATSYFSRMWKRGQLIADEPQFKGVVADYYGKLISREFERASYNLRKRFAQLDQEKADITLSPEQRAQTLKELEIAKSLHEATRIELSTHADRLSEIASDMRKAKEAGDDATLKAAKIERGQIIKEGGKDLNEFLEQRTTFNRRQRHIELGSAGLQERSDRVLSQLADIEESNHRAMGRLV